MFKLDWRVSDSLSVDDWHNTLCVCVCVCVCVAFGLHLLVGQFTYQCGNKILFVPKADVFVSGGKTYDNSQKMCTAEGGVLPEEKFPEDCLQRFLRELAHDHNVHRFTVYKKPRRQNHCMDSRGIYIWCKITLRTVCQMK